MARHRSPALPAAVLLLAVAAVAAFLLLRGGGDDETPQRAERGPAATATATAEATRTPEPETAEATRTPAPGTEAAPARAVRGFYEAAAANEWDRAWAALGPRFQGQFGSQQAMQAELDSLERIRFRRLRVVDHAGGQATVELSTVATHSDRVDRCTGTLRAVRIEGTWRVEPMSVTCTSG